MRCKLDFITRLPPNLFATRSVANALQTGFYPLPGNFKVKIIRNPLSKNHLVVVVAQLVAIGGRLDSVRLDFVIALKEDIASIKEEGTTNSYSDDDFGSEHVLDDVHLTPGPYSESRNQKVLSIQPSVNMLPVNTRLEGMLAFIAVNPPYAMFKDFNCIFLRSGQENASSSSFISRKK
ncbi:hypothetical protein E3N88_05557 [Mikania micrantha]|uniref:Uncharacterized protein n=1 Tax=Mikania micrantha TaxID=192012 RepID=A0A5N6PM38_9ASTR|nr:hypothetical protein E3N88_05557 [Mikania micrantha]